jgi:hypothetical protein
VLPCFAISKSGGYDIATRPTVALATFDSTGTASYVDGAGNVFVAPFHARKRSIYQDRRGMIIGKVEKKTRHLLQAALSPRRVLTSKRLP